MSSETRAAARRRLAAAFAEAGIDSADADARLLVCAAARIDHAGFVRDPDVPLDRDERACLAGFATRRLAREPVSRITGRRAFWSLDFALAPSVLDPRPETEGLVASVLDAIGGRRAAPLAILDLGVGSGAILAALLAELPAAHGVGVDRSEPACRVARANLANLGLAARAGIVRGDWTSALSGRFAIVVANPPYVETGDMAGLAREVRDYDPHEALDGGADGLNCYRAIVPHLDRLMGPGAIAAFECGAGQGAPIAAMMAAQGLAGAAVYKDLAGHDRVVLAAKS